ncbi:hypothetical protein BC830DRAFT_1164602 [Chytriomyces sp. MP71]|nr:hypothetical protein BC830DRAFT_1164602 [Chytriomyces sp. MP71]
MQPNELPSRERELVGLSAICLLGALHQFLSLHLISCVEGIVYSVILFYCGTKAGGLTNKHVVNTVSVLTGLSLLSGILALRIEWLIVWGVVAAVLVPYWKPRDHYIPI